MLAATLQYQKSYMPRNELHHFQGNKGLKPVEEVEHSEQDGLRYQRSGHWRETSN
jgi:hypothetical protein